MQVCMLVRRSELPDCTAENVDRIASRAELEITSRNIRGRTPCTRGTFSHLIFSQKIELEVVSYRSCHGPESRPLHFAYFLYFNSYTLIKYLQCQNNGCMPSVTVNGVMYLYTLCPVYSLRLVHNCFNMIMLLKAASPPASCSINMIVQVHHAKIWPL